MAREDVNIKVSANVAEAIQMWKAMEQGPEGMAKALDSMGQKGKQSTKGLADEVVGLVGKWASAAATVKLVTDELRAQADMMRQMRNERLGTTNTVDEAWNRFQVQSGIPNGPRADQVRTQLLQIIANRKAAPIPGLMAAEQLGSAGASVEDILGGGLDEYLQMTTGSNASADQAVLAKSVVMFLEANGRKPNREGMKETSLAIQQLFGGTNLQASNLDRFAPEAGKIAQMSHMTIPEQLAAYSQFLGTNEEAGAATAFRSGINSLATAGATPDKVRALQRLGLTPADVDFQGENYWAVQSRLVKGFGSVSPEQRNIAAKEIFGDEGMGFYNILLQPGSAEETKRRVEIAKDPTGAAERLKIAEGSRAAAARAAQTAAAAAEYRPGEIDMDVVRNRLKGLSAQLGLDDSTGNAARRILDDDSDFFGLMDVSPEERIRRTSLYLERWSGVPTGPIFNQHDTTHVSREQASQYLNGQLPLRIDVNVKGAHGLDIPSTVEAQQLSQ